MRSSFLTLGGLLAACWVSQAAAQSIDPSDCQDRADRLRRDARDLVDAASALDTDDRDRRRSAERDLRSQFEEVRSSFARAASACGAASVFPAVIASIRGYLVAVHGDTPATRERIKAVDDALVSLARVHARAQPVDYRMTYAMAETVFTALER
jgi:hypothetical protein